MEKVARKNQGDLISDTAAAVNAVQIEILRRAGVHGRITLAFSMSKAVCALSRRAIARAHPGISDDELNVRFAAAHYGPKLAEALRLDLAARRA